MTTGVSWGLQMADVGCVTWSLLLLAEHERQIMLQCHGLRQGEGGVGCFQLMAQVMEPVHTQVDGGKIHPPWFKDNRLRSLE